jgi:hypothetical protein
MWPHLGLDRDVQLDGAGQEGATAFLGAERGGAGPEGVGGVGGWGGEGRPGAPRTLAPPPAPPPAPRPLTTSTQVTSTRTESAITPGCALRKDV